MVIQHTESPGGRSNDPAGGHAVLRFARAVDAALDKAVSIEPAFAPARDKAEALRVLHRAEQRLTGLRLRVLAASGDVAEESGARDVGAWLAAETRTERGPNVDERSQEFPRINERRTGKRHRFGYSVGFRDGLPGDAVLRHDLAAGSTAVRNLGAGREANEFCFVANDDAGGRAEEAAGVLMGYVFDRAAGTSDLVLLDAETLEDVATVHLPARVPVGFHGSWNPAR